MHDPQTPTQIIAAIKSDKRHVLVIVAIPSHDRRNRPINNQEFWADAALVLFNKLFGGATAFKTFKGIYRSDDGEDLWDEPILIESYVDLNLVEDLRTLEQLRRFLRRMRRETNQAVVLLVIDSYRFFIK